MTGYGFLPLKEEARVADIPVTGMISVRLPRWGEVRESFVPSFNFNYPVRQGALFNRTRLEHSYGLTVLTYLHPLGLKYQNPRGSGLPFYPQFPRCLPCVTGEPPTSAECAMGPKGLI